MKSQRQIVRGGSPASVSQRQTTIPKLHWLWFGLFAVTLAFLGGSSWPDPIHHALLRPVVALLLIPVLSQLRMKDIQRAQVPFLLLLLLLIWMVLQLVPLPPAVWQTLPDRQGLAELDYLAGLNDVWRPISLTPFRGLNAAFGMVVPLTALLLALAMRIPARALLLVVFGIGVFDAALVLLQVVGGSESPFYLFPNPSPGAAEGIFANENHSAVFSAIVMLIVARLALETSIAKDPSWLRLSYAPAFVLVLLAVLVSGSRAGLAVTLVVLLASAGMIWLETRDRAADFDGRHGATLWRTRGRLALAGCAAAILLLIAAFAWLERTPAFEDIINAGSFDDLRWSLLPILGDVAATHWLLGTGFGSFEAVYHAYEPTELLLPLYVNQAHNDWAQLAIEGGAPAVVLLAGFLWWFGKAVLGLRASRQARAGQIIFWTACVAIIAAASVVDYPLRTPVFQAVAVWLLLCLSADRAKTIGV